MGDSQELVQAAMEAWVMARSAELRLDGMKPGDARRKAIMEARQKFHSIGFGAIE